VPSNRAAELETRERGENHKSTLEDYQALAEVLTERGKHAEAEDVLRKTLAERQQTLGKDHQATVKTLAELAFVLSCQDMYEESEIVCREVATREEKDEKKALGVKHSPS
jgi:DNA-binding ferritin-like protein